MFRLTSRKMKCFLSILAACSILGSAATYAAEESNELRFIEVQAKTKEERSAIANTGVSIESISSDSVWAFANSRNLEKLKAEGFKILGNFDFSVARGGHENLFGFPPGDARFHTYDQNVAALKELQTKNPEISQAQVIGKSLENRDIWALHINTTPSALQEGFSTKPGIIFMGNHHAREHLSLEVPLMLAQYLLANKAETKVANLLNTRDIWIIPMVNPDGAEYDISTGNYRWWRKNRRSNGNGTFGVDLNRNYSYKWGTGGSDTDPSSEVYMGTQPFSEPETQTIRDFVSARANTKILLSFHTFSELILYPWGHTYDPVANAKDRAAYENMATTMAKWNRYKPQQSSALYIASGDTTDWAYGDRGIFSFTFELSPRSIFEGGFYPGARVIDKVFNDNLQPCLYLIGMADDPYKSLTDQPVGYLKNYVEPRIPEAFMWQPEVKNLQVSTISLK